MIRKIGIVCLLLYCAPEIRAQKLWTLHDCMVYAVDNAPRHKIQELTNANLQKNQRDAMLGLAPTISGSTGGSYTSGYAAGEDNVNRTQNAFSNSYSVNASLYVFNGFQAVSGLRVAKIARLQGLEESRRIADQIALETMQAYFNVLYAKGMVDLAREQLSESRQRLKEIETRVELGLKSSADLLQAEAEIALRNLTLTQQQNLYNDYLLQLKEYMFYPLNESLRIDTMAGLEVNLLPETELRDETFKDALEFLPRARQAVYEIEAARSEYRSSRWQLLPSLSANAGYNTSFYREDGTSVHYWDYLADKQRKSVGFTLSVPIFNGLKRQSNVSRAKNNLKMAELQRDQTFQEIEATIQRTVQELEGKTKEYVHAVKWVLSEEESHRVNQRKYEEGLITILELQISANNLLDARANRLGALLAYQIKRREVAYYRGTSYLEQVY